MRKIFDKPSINTEYLEETMRNIDIINDNPDEIEVEKALNRINEVSNKNYEIDYFFEYWGWISLEDLAKEVVLQKPPKVEDIELEEVIQVVEIIQELIKKAPPEDQVYMEYYMELLNKSLGLSDVYDYIFHPEKKELKGDGLGEAEEVGKKMWKDARENVVYL